MPRSMPLGTRRCVALLSLLLSLSFFACAVQQDSWRSGLLSSVQQTQDDALSIATPERQLTQGRHAMPAAVSVRGVAVPLAAETAPSPTAPLPMIPSHPITYEICSSCSSGSAPVVRVRTVVSGIGLVLLNLLSADGVPVAATLTRVAAVEPQELEWMLVSPRSAHSVRITSLDHLLALHHMRVFTDGQRTHAQTACQQQC